jgi:hypothetical protein
VPIAAQIHARSKAVGRVIEIAPVPALLAKKWLVFRQFPDRGRNAISAMRESPMISIYDYVTVACFAGLVCAFLFLTERDRKILVHLMVPAIAFAAANQLGNAGLSLFATIYGGRWRRLRRHHCPQVTDPRKPSWTR